jgi:hypothetical protein
MENERVSLHSEFSERVLLAACIHVDENFREILPESIEKGLQCRHFEKRWHKILWHVIQQIYESEGVVSELMVMEALTTRAVATVPWLMALAIQAGKPVNASLADHLKEMNIEAVSSVMEIAVSMFSRRDVDVALKTLVDLDKLRRAVSILKQSAAELLRPVEHMEKLDVEKRIADVTSDIFDLTKEVVSDGARPVGAVVEEAYRQLQDYRKLAAEKKISGVPSGFPEVDQTYFGFQRGDLISIAARPSVGKTALGLSKDWNVTVEEAQNTLEKWYADRPEVRQWQEQVLAIARSTGSTRTLMGRYRDLPDIASSNRALRGRAQRAAINTPIQGGAADIVMMAMLRIAKDERLKSLGWKLLLQIHDEVILEGPSETSEDALQAVVDCMEHPLSRPLLVHLVADASIADTWYDGK